jgi:4-hydroxy-tetrahydrodipicolinate synthase
MRELWRIPTVVALKESSGNIQQISRIAAELPAGKTLLAGDDGLLLPTIAGGGHGIVSVAGNVVPQAIRELLVAAKSSDLKSARRQLTALQPLFDALSLEPNPTSIKAAVALMGMASATPRLPLLPATEATRNAIRTALQQTRSLSTHV